MDDNGDAGERNPAAGDAAGDATSRRRRRRRLPLLRAGDGTENGAHHEEVCQPRERRSHARPPLHLSSNYLMARRAADSDTKFS